VDNLSGEHVRGKSICLIEKDLLGPDGGKWDRFFCRVGDSDRGGGVFQVRQRASARLSKDQKGRREGRPTDSGGVPPNAFTIRQLRIEFTHTIRGVLQGKKVYKDDARKGGWRGGHRNGEGEKERHMHEGREDLKRESPFSGRGRKPARGGKGVLKPSEAEKGSRLGGSISC